MIELKKYKFDSLYKMSSGISSKPAQAGHGAPFVSFSDVFKNYFLPESLTNLMDTSDKEQITYSIKKGDIFLTRTSETKDELGMSCVAVKGYPKATYSGFVKRLRPIVEGVTYDKYMAFYLRGALFRKTMDNNAVMTLRASLNEKIFSYLDLFLPPYDIQVKIGDFLYDTYQKIELNKKINTELEAMAKLIYDYWFVQFDFPNEEGKPYKSSGGEMVYNEVLKREIPEGWIEGNLSDIATIVGGSTPSRKVAEYFCKNGTAWITPKDLSLNKGNRFIEKGELDVTEAGIKSASLNIMPAGTVLLSSRAPIGYMAIATKKVTTNQGFKSLIPQDGYTSEFIFYKVKNCIPIIENNASGSTFKEVSLTSIKNIKISLPPKNIITNYTDKIKPLFERQKMAQKENKKLKELRDWLLPMLMNGQIKINHS